VRVPVPDTDAVLADAMAEQADVRRLTERTLMLDMWMIFTDIADLGMSSPGRSARCLA
jgi:hypothetical protein